jgi:hypothetical protein
VSIFEVTKGAVNEMSNDYQECGIPLINNLLSKTVNGNQKRTKKSLKIPTG